MVPFKNVTISLTNNGRLNVSNVLAPAKWRKRMPVGEDDMVYKLGRMLNIPNARRLKTLWPIFRKEVTETNVF